ncbi:MAG: hypothetical protein WAX66_00640 [Patescibacteria group bacterium]
MYFVPLVLSLLQDKAYLRHFIIPNTISKSHRIYEITKISISDKFGFMVNFEIDKGWDNNMDHLAIMNKKKKLLEKILSGEKTIESRWYVNRISPWNKIKKGEIVWFKNSGEKVTLKANVSKVLQFDNLTPNKILEILKLYGKEIGFKEEKYKEWAESSSNKHYCILVFLSDPKLIEPFEINKAGFGISSAWISVDDVNKLRK